MDIADQQPSVRVTTESADEALLRASWLPLMLVCFTGLVSVFNASVLPMAISGVVEGLDTTISNVQLAIVAYGVFVAAFTVTGGKISGVLGAKNTQLLGLTVYAAGMLICVLARDVSALIAGEAVAGLGGALLVPNALAILGQAYSGAQRTVAVSILAGTTGIGAALALLVGGFLVQTWGWRAPFALLLVIIVGTLVIASRVVLPRTAFRGSIDKTSIALSAVGVLLLVAAINQIGAWGLLLAAESAPANVLGMSPVLALLVLGALVLHVFAARQHSLVDSGRTALLDPQVFGSGLNRACLSGLVAVNLLMAGVSYLLPLYTQMVLGKSPMGSAMMLVPISLAALVSAAVTPVLMRLFACRPLLTAAHVLAAASVMLLALTISNQWSGGWTGVSEVCLGLGIGVGLSAGSALLMETNPPSLSGEIGSARGMANFLGLCTGTAVAGAVLMSVLTQSASSRIADDPDLRSDSRIEVTTSSVSFVENDDLRGRLAGLDLTSEQLDRAVTINIESRLVALRASLFVLGLAVLLPIVTFRHLPSRREPDA
ncbi:MFS transporter [Rhodococcus tukisamuensis]|uniref:Major Facilitator Superfamily protein n=2 Tax=Rhodococcus tukisamuensis TaxID=168276 RepID=A0A1G6NSF8_9NOCA|nr:MFS transporter [Rhodococcus tukisamuensis]SDC70551.1 Major Facilitator Superfamily protein [Rhodococcus tukisamuensis]